MEINPKYNKKLLGGGFVLFLVVLVAIGISVYFLVIKPESKDGYDVTTVSDTIKLISTDTNGNITTLPNLLNDLQKQIDTLKIQMASKTTLDNLTTQLNNLNTQTNNIINGVTTLQNTKVTGTLTTDSLRLLSPTTPGPTTR